MRNRIRLGFGFVSRLWWRVQYTHSSPARLRFILRQGYRRCGDCKALQGCNRLILGRSHSDGYRWPCPILTGIGLRSLHGLARLVLSFYFLRGYARMTSDGLYGEGRQGPKPLLTCVVAQATVLAQSRIVLALERLYHSGPNLARTLTFCACVRRPLDFGPFLLILPAFGAGTFLLAVTRCFLVDGFVSACFVWALNERLRALARTELYHSALPNPACHVHACSRVNAAYCLAVKPIGKPWQLPMAPAFPACATARKPVRNPFTSATLTLRVAFFHSTSPVDKSFTLADTGSPLPFSATPTM